MSWLAPVILPANELDQLCDALLTGCKVAAMHAGSYATQFAISLKSLINDDLGAFRDWGATAERMAAETEANLLLSKLLSNPAMGQDGVALFHATHGNLAAGSALDVTALDLARKAMRGRKALDGTTPINAVRTHHQGWRLPPPYRACHCEPGRLPREPEALRRAGRRPARRKSIDSP